MLDIARKRITVMGLGTRGGGVGVAHYLATHGAFVTVTDGKSAGDLQEPMAELDGLPIRYVLGGHQERDFTSAGADMVVRNPAVRNWSPWLVMARDSGVPVEMEMSIFLKCCPAPVIGITGTKGKSTTSALCGAMLRQWRPDTIVAGNMGVSAVAHLDDITADTRVVLELSSWQLEGLDEHRLGPQIAVLTNISQDHLDAYNSFEDYAEWKRSIARYLRPNDVFIVNADDPLSWIATSSTSARIAPFSSEQRDPGVFARNDEVIWNLPESRGAVTIPDKPYFRGAPLQRNIAAAVGAAVTRGADRDAIERGLQSFTGIANRSELVATIDDVEYVNDTAATAPAAVVAAMEAMQGRRVHVLAGGSDKRSDLTPLADALARFSTSVTLLDGTATPKLREMLAERSARVVGTFDSMDSAIVAARDQSRPGDVVLLSPGCASFGMFRDEFDRGDQFRRAVAALQPSPRVS